jgi:hypothetical protein
MAAVMEGETEKTAVEATVTVVMVAKSEKIPEENAEWQEQQQQQYVNMFSPNTTRIHYLIGRSHSL